MKFPKIHQAVQVDMCLFFEIVLFGSFYKVKGKEKAIVKLFLLQNSCGLDLLNK